MGIPKEFPLLMDSADSVDNALCHKIDHAKVLSSLWQDIRGIILRPSYVKRIFFFVLCDVAIIVMSLYFAFLLRFEFAIPGEYLHRVFQTLPLFIILKLAIFAIFRIYQVSWRFVGIRDLWNILTALVLSESVLMLLFSLSPTYMTYLHIQALPRSIFVIDCLLSLLMMGGLRVAKRIYIEVLRAGKANKPGKRTIILGADYTGDCTVRYLVNGEQADFNPVAILNDREENVGNYLHGIKVYGTFRDLQRAAAKFRAEALVVALSNPDHELLRQIHEAAKEAHIRTIKIVPRFSDHLNPPLNLKNLEEISIEDLIGRRPVQIDYAEIGRFIANQTVLITGAGGSIGSEITMQVSSFNPQRIVLLDTDETELHNLAIRLKQIHPHYLYKGNGAGTSPAREQSGGKVRISFVVGDVRDREFIDALFDDIRPDIVYHAAAYKHVPIMESNSNEAVKVNMFGTWNLAQASVRCGVGKFIMISTDKAVRPTSVMGATKRMAEYICKAYNESRGCRFTSVRFGNVLGSRGSVLPIFMEQLKQGGPLTITHKDMVRYFMTIPEAVSLVLQSSVMSNGGGYVMALDMGAPVRVVNLAEDLIRIHGLEPYKDIQLSFIGVRPGEKLFEEVLTAEEGTVASRHEKVFIAKDSVSYTRKEIEGMLGEFGAVLKSRPYNGNGQVRALLRKYVKHYN